MPKEYENAVREWFDLSGRVAFITGGAGLLGPMHGLAIAECGGTPVLADIDEERACEKADEIRTRTGQDAFGVRCDVTDPTALRRVLAGVERDAGPVDILINNAAHDPKVQFGDEVEELTRLEHLPLERWEKDLAVGLTGAFLCAQIIGAGMAERRQGVILNIASDLGLIAPDQRLYSVDGRQWDEQPVKPVTYSVVKHGLIGLTRYLATYWADRNVRVNALAPGGVYQSQPAAFLERLHDKIPMGRMARVDEYCASVAFLCSDASSYITGAVLCADGGRTTW